MKKTGNGNICYYPFFIARNRPTLLIGFMCSGKTTTGQTIADILNCEFLDLDILFEKQVGFTIAEYIRHFDETSFREIETKILQHNLKNRTQLILATGGGVGHSKENVELIKQNNSTIFLNPSWAEIWRRLSIRSNYNTRPLLHNKTKAEVLNIYEQRLPIYKDLANFVINDDNIQLDKLKEIIS